MRFVTFFTIISIGTLTVWAPQSAAQEEVYRWVDDKGVVHFGDRPPQQADVEKISIPDTQTQPAANQEEAQDTQPNLAQQLREERAEARKEREANAEVAAKSCAKAREIVSQLEPMTRVMVTHEDGTVTRMYDNDRLEKLDEAKAVVAENCDK